ncbi:MAG: hypothetical protein RL701_3719 [Pseudomonadota bacterium]
MAAVTRGTIDFGQEGFSACFENDAGVVSEVKALQRRRWLQAKQAWIVEPHGPSITGLLRIAYAHDWTITPGALDEMRRVREDEASLEYSVDVVQGKYGEPWFLCKLGNDDVLLAQVKAIPDALWDGEWWVPAYRAECCAPLLEVVQSDQRLEVSDLAWKLLQEPDDSYPELQPQAAGAGSQVAWLSLDDSAEYERVERECRERLRAVATAAQNAEQLACIQQLRQACGSQKVGAVASWMQAFLDSGEPLIVLAHQRAVITQLTARFPAASCITDDHTEAERARAVGAFENSEASLLICTTNFAHSAAQLTRPATLAFAELGWSAAAHLKSEPARTVWYLAAEDTIDTLVLDAMQRNTAGGSQLAEHWLIELANALVQSVRPARKAKVTTKSKKPQQADTEKDKDKSAG